MNATKTYAASTIIPRAVVIACSDSRFQQAFRDFLADEYGLTEGMYYPVFIKGGLAGLSAREIGSVNCVNTTDQVKFFMEHCELVVAFNHEDCRHYNDAGFTGHEKKEAMEAFLSLHSILPNDVENRAIRLHVHYAYFKDDFHLEILFEEIGK